MTYDDAYIDHVAAIYRASPTLSRVVMSFETFIALRWLADNTLPSMPHQDNRCASPFFPLLPEQLAVQQRLDAAERNQP